MFGSTFSVGGLLTDATTVVASIGAVAAVVLAFKLGPRALSWGIGKIKFGK